MKLLNPVTSQVKREERANLNLNRNFFPEKSASFFRPWETEEAAKNYSPYKMQNMLGTKVPLDMRAKTEQSSTTIQRTQNTSNIAGTNLSFLKGPKKKDGEIPKKSGEKGIAQIKNEIFENYKSHFHLFRNKSTVPAIKLPPYNQDSKENWKVLEPWSPSERNRSKERNHTRSLDKTNESLLDLLNKESFYFEKNPKVPSGDLEKFQPGFGKENENRWRSKRLETDESQKSHPEENAKLRSKRCNSTQNYGELPPTKNFSENPYDPQLVNERVLRPLQTKKRTVFPSLGKTEIQKFLESFDGDTSAKVKAKTSESISHNPEINRQFFGLNKILKTDLEAFDDAKLHFEAGKPVRTVPNHVLARDPFDDRNKFMVHSKETFSRLYKRGQRKRKVLEVKEELNKIEAVSGISEVQLKQLSLSPERLLETRKLAKKFEKNKIPLLRQIKRQIIAIKKEDLAANEITSTENMKSNLTRAKSSAQIGEAPKSNGGGGKTFNLREIKVGVRNNIRRKENLFNLNSTHNLTSNSSLRLDFRPKNK